MDYLPLNLTTTPLPQCHHNLHLVERDIPGPQVSWQVPAAALGSESRDMDSGARAGKHGTHSSGFAAYPAPAPLLPSPALLLCCFKPRRRPGKLSPHPQQERPPLATRKNCPLVCRGEETQFGATSTPESLSRKEAIVISPGDRREMVRPRSGVDGALFFHCLKEFQKLCPVPEVQKKLGSRIPGVLH